jgi:hypothetical protein
MDRLKLLAQDKNTMADLREYFRLHLEKKIIAQAMHKKPVEGYAEASGVIKVALDELEDLTKVKKKSNLNQSI